MPPDVTPAEPEPRRCQYCGTVAVYRPDQDGALLVCPSDDCDNIVVLALPTERSLLSRAVEPPADELDPEVSGIVAQADRIAAALIAEYEPVTYDRTVAVIALAYAKGRRDGYAEGAKFVDEALERLKQDVAL